MPPRLDASWRQRTASRLLRHFSARAPRPSLPRVSHGNPGTRVRGRRSQSTGPGPGPEPSPQQTRRIARILTRASRFLPQRLQASLRNLRSAPFSHVAAFLVLHEVTAVLPIFGLTYAFHALDWAPTGWVLGPWAAWAEDGLRRWVPYFRRKQWFGLESRGDDERQGRGADGEDVLESELREHAKREQEREGREGKRGWFARFSGKGAADAAKNDTTSTSIEDNTDDRGKNKESAAIWRKAKEAATVDNTGKAYKIGIQIAAAYTITKLLLVPRIALSLWMTPWLARGFVRFRHAVRRKRN
ncbi:hypothetical protein F4802DRAFT_190875 [Xylaria palmicola]|nr:hypothetical protein F4802DRAFT_190875 [Xylaria palmicola]